MAQKTTPEMVTEATLKAYAGAADPRMREVLAEVITALHGVARRIKLTPDELIRLTEFLVWGGKISDQKRHEFILMSDTLGLTMLVETMADDLPEGAFEPSVLGPFYREGAPLMQAYETISRGANDGTPALVTGRVLDIDGTPIAGAELDIWQTNNNGLYENVDPGQPDFNLRGRLFTGPDGAFAFWTVRPQCYPIPIDGPVGKLLEVGGRHNMRPAHIHFIVSAEGYKTVVSELFDAEDPWIAGDAVFGVKDSLKVRFVETLDPQMTGPHALNGPFFRMSYDFVLVRGYRPKLSFSTDR
jgi:protocatechuate 3,4-dioxygenase beta subunit